MIRKLKLLVGLCAANLQKMAINDYKLLDYKTHKNQTL